jgi:hypothetical protein
MVTTIIYLRRSPFIFAVTIYWLLISILYSAVVNASLQIIFCLISFVLFYYVLYVSHSIT